jgi:hypothetical protein
MTIPAWRQMLVWLHARQRGDPVVAAMMAARLQDGQPMSGRGNEMEDEMEDDGWA